MFTEPWLHRLSLIMSGLGVASMLLAALQMRRRPPSMTVMAFVWPICALFGGPLLLGYLFWYRRQARPPPAAGIATATLHCGAGCTLGDLLGESAAFCWPPLLRVFGAGTLFGDPMYAAWLLDLVLAFVFGIGFQYFSSMRRPGAAPGARLLAAVKADALSLAAWQAGMYGAMAIGQIVLLPRLVGSRAPVDSVEFWALMQLAMVAGYASSFPMNVWLVRRGIKQPM
jgi:hypothetical protein